MKKVEANRYPHSATLFKFCKEALEIRHSGAGKVIDQDVGAILGYDPADCSHWKKGKKNIRSLGTLKSIAEHLKVDQGLLIDITSGKVSLDEAVFEFRGYGDFQLNAKTSESIKKDFFKNSPNRDKERDPLFDLQRQKISALAEALALKAGIKEPPVYLPEILRILPEITLVRAADQASPVVITRTEDEGSFKTLISVREEEQKPYVRFTVARQVFLHLCQSGAKGTEAFEGLPAELLEIQANIFAGCLLVPGALLRQEVDGVQGSLDLLRHLGESFWVSRALMNQRLKDYVDYRV